MCVCVCLFVCLFVCLGVFLFLFKWLLALTSLQRSRGLASNLILYDVAVGELAQAGESEHPISQDGVQLS